jgi:hypothetical protein
MTVANYGPFAHAIGYAGAIMASSSALFALWGGKMDKWRPPEEDLPGTAQKAALLLCGVGIVFQWYLAAPERIIPFFIAIAIEALICVFGLLKYSRMIGTFIYSVEIVTGPDSVRRARILGGTELLPEAEAIRMNNRIDIQALLRGAAYNPDLLWSRQSRAGIKQSVLALFVVILVSGTSALTGASLAVQVLITKKAASGTFQAIGGSDKGTAIPGDGSANKSHP